MTARKAPLRAIGYARISSDDTERGLGVERQTHDVLARIEREGWQLVDMLTDNNVSASRYSTKARKGWLRMLELAEAGAVDALVLYDIDRLTRQPKELERLIDLAERGLRIVTLSGELDLASGDGRMIARMLVAQAAKSSDDTSRRLKRQLEQRRADGRAHWSRRPFGFELNGEHKASEAVVLRELYARFIGGEALASLARWLQLEGIASPGGAPFTATSVRALLKADRNAGVYRSTLEGIAPKRADWQPIVDAETFEAARRLLAVNRERVAARGNGLGNARAHLMPGLLTCAECGQPMSIGYRGTSSTRDKPYHRLYRCRNDAAQGYKGCGLTIVAGQVDDAVRAAVLECLADADKRALLEQPGDEAGTLAELEAVIAEAALRKAERMADLRNRKLGLTMADIAPELEDIAVTIEQAEAAKLRLRRSSPLQELPTAPELLAEAWELWSIDQRRATIADVLERVSVRRAVVRGRRFDPERLELVYRYERASDELAGAHDAA